MTSLPYFGVKLSFALCLLIEKIAYKYPKVTYSYPKVTHSYPKVIHSYPKVTYSYSRFIQKDENKK